MCNWGPKARFNCFRLALLDNTSVAMSRWVRQGNRGGTEGRGRKLLSAAVFPNLLWINPSCITCTPVAFPEDQHSCSKWLIYLHKKVYNVDIVAVCLKDTVIRLTFILLHFSSLKRSFGPAWKFPPVSLWTLYIISCSLKKNWHNWSPKMIIHIMFSRIWRSLLWVKWIIWPGMNISRYIWDNV